MPATHVECCGELFTVEEVLEKHLADRRNNCEWTFELAAAMLDHSVAHPSNEDPSRISTTVLTSKCLRRTALERSVDYPIQLSDLYAAFRGTLLHGQLERFVHPTSYGEVRFGVDDLGKKLPWVKEALPRMDRSFTGSPDLVDPCVGILYDYKRVKEVPRFNTVWPDHVAQLNINRWLVDNADWVETRNGEKFDLHKNKNIRAQFVPVDWQELIIVYIDDKGPKPITVTESIDVPKVGGVGTKKARVATIWDDDRVEEYIATNYVEARMALKTGLAPIPEGWEGQSHVLCGYCHVRDKCASLEKEGK